MMLDPSLQKGSVGEADSLKNIYNYRNGGLGGNGGGGSPYVSYQLPVFCYIDICGRTLKGF